MKLTFLDPLYAEPGPYACAYLDTSRDIADPEKAIELRWRHVHDELSSQGADTATMEALAEAVGADRQVSGRHGQAIFAGHGHVILVEELPEPPVWDAARFSSLPDALPLAVQHAPDIPYVAVAVHRADQRARRDRRETGPVQEEELEVDFEAGRWPASRVAPGARQHRSGPAEDWPRGAVRIVVELEDLADRSGAEVVVLGGEAWARNVLVNRMPRRLRERVVTVAPSPRPEGGEGQQEDGGGRALLERELGELFRGGMSAVDRGRTQTFLARRSRRRGAVEGMSEVVAALQRGQAKALLLNTPVEFPAPLWAGSEPTQIALSAADLQSYGVLSFEEGPAGAALIRALVRTRAELVLVPRADLPMEDGVGVLLRYSD